jgi:hypothetical protein
VLAVPTDKRDDVPDDIRGAVAASPDKIVIFRAGGDRHDTARAAHVSDPDAAAIGAIVLGACLAASSERPDVLAGRTGHAVALPARLEAAPEHHIRWDPPPGLTEALERELAVFSILAEDDTFEFSVLLGPGAPPHDLQHDLPETVGSSAFDLPGDGALAQEHQLDSGADGSHGYDQPAAQSEYLLV